MQTQNKKIIEIAKIVKSGTKKYSGTKEYVATGDLIDTKIVNSRKFTFKEKPSRANMEAKEGDVIFAKMKGTKKVFLITKNEINYIFSTGFAVLRSEKKFVTPSYLYNFLRSSIFQKIKDQHSRGGTQKAINNSRIQKIMIPIPSLSIQNKISTLLNKADIIIEKKEEVQNLMGVFTQSLYREMFGEPSINPHNYPMKNLGEICNLIKDGPHTSPSYTKTGVPFLTVHNVNNGYFDLSDVKYISSKDHVRFCKRTKPEYGDVLYTKGGVLAGIAKEIDVDFEFSIWVHLALLKLKKELINPTYLEAVLNSSFGKSQAKKYKRGIANKDIVLGRIKKIVIPIPPLKKQEEFAIAVKKIRKLINSSNMSLEMTSELRNSLQVKIFKGKIKR